MNELRTGFTTGTCAAAAAKAAALCLATGEPVTEVEVPLPDGSRLLVPADYCLKLGESAEAGVKKDAGDDPDVTNGMLVVAAVSWADGEDIVLAAGEGVGTITKPGLSIPPGEPAINPAPRRMIREAVREVTSRGVKVTISVPGGAEVAEKTFNPRLGVVGGLSILGTTGIVRPFSCAALRDALKCSLDVAAACGVTAPVLVPGHIGEKAARKHFQLTAEQVVEVSNEWGFVLDHVPGYHFARLLLVGHPGKLAKISAGQWDTHSSRSESPVPIVTSLGESVLGHPVPESTTVEGIFAGLPPEESKRLGEALGYRVREAVSERIGGSAEVAVALVNMKGEMLGQSGDLAAWE